MRWDTPKYVTITKKKEVLVSEATVWRCDLQGAASKGNKEAIELLLTHGADVNERNSYGLTPLHFAAAAGDKEIIELLLAHGADVNAATKDGKTPADIAANYKYQDVVDLLRQHGGRGAEAAVAESPLAPGADVNVRDKDGDTPLSRAAVPNAYLLSEAAIYIHCQVLQKCL